MTLADKRNALIFAGLLVVAGVTWYMVLRPSPTATSGVQQPGVKTRGPKQSGVTDAQIRLDLADSAADLEVGRKNLFQYRQPPAPARPPEPPPAAVVYRPPPPPSTPPGPPQPILPPFKDFRYEGYSVLGDPKTGKQMASLSESGYLYHLTVNEMLGAYRVVRITDSIVEIEDTATKQRRTFNRVQQ